MTRFLKTIGRWLLGLTLLVCVTSCSRGPTFAEVSGTVRLNGKPIDQLTVEFVPDPAKGATGPNSIGTTDAQGRFTLATYTNTPGAVVGQHRVVIKDIINYPTTREGMRAGTMGNKPVRISARFGDASTTPIHKEVKTGGPQTIDLDVTGPP